MVKNTPLGNLSPAMLFVVGLSTAFVIFIVIQVFNDPSILLQTVSASLGLGAVYSIIALGFVLIFKATQTINFAQGSLAVAGALFLSFSVADGHIPFTTIANPLLSIGGPSWVPWVLSLLMALIFSAILGAVVERIAIRPMVGQPLFSVAVITLGLEFILRTLNNDTSETEFRSLEVPWGIGGFSIGEAFINWSYIVSIFLAVVSFIAVYFFYRSRLGIAMRAVAFDQEAAMAQGIDVGKVFAIAWIAGSMLAALGGIMGSQPPVRQTGAIDPQTANIAFRALPAVVLGGLDSATGALLGGLIVGFAEIFAGQYLSSFASTIGAGYPLVIPYVVMLVGLVVRPHGIYGTPEIRRV